MKRIRVSGIGDAIGFLLYLSVVRYTQPEVGWMRSLHHLFMALGAIYFISVYMIEVRKVRR